MQLEVILEPDLSPAEVAEIAVEAERLGFRTLWHSNYHQNPDAFVALVPAAMATSRIKLGVLAVSPYEQHPLKMGNALLTLNEIADGRAIVGIGGGGAVISSMGGDTIRLDRTKMRMVTAVREGIEIVNDVVSGEAHGVYEGEIFSVSRPFHHTWKKAPTAQVFSCATGPMMMKVAGEIADCIIMSDVVPERTAEQVALLDPGFAERPTPPVDFRIGNCWAWHIKADPEESMREARRELVFRQQMIISRINKLPWVTDEERQDVVDNYRSFLKAYWTRTGDIDGVPTEITDKIIAGCSSAGGLDKIEGELERFRLYEQGGVTDLSFRLFDDPMTAIHDIAEHVMPHFEKYDPAVSAV